MWCCGRGVADGAGRRVEILPQPWHGGGDAGHYRLGLRPQEAAHRQRRRTLVSTVGRIITHARQAVSKYFEPDGVTDWGATRLSATVTGAKKSDPDADGNVTYTVTCAARARMDYTVAEGVEPFCPAWTCVLELVDLRSGYTFRWAI